MNTCFMGVCPVLVYLYLQEARPPASAFIGYGGVVTRATVKAGADWFVTDFQDLIDAL